MKARFLFLPFAFSIGGLATLGFAPALRAQESPSAPARTVEIGLGLRFMPIGWFDLADAARRTGFRAYPALGFAPFLDYRLGRYFSVGLSPEVTLNVIPNRSDCPVGQMLAPTVRLQARYPNRTRFEPYALLTGGYSVILQDESDSASGLLAGGAIGVRARFANRHAVFGQVTYQKGFQTLAGEAYAPSYIITELGWQVGF